MEQQLGMVEEKLPAPELYFGAWLEWVGANPFKPHELSKSEEAEAGMMAWELDHEDPWNELDATP